MNNWKTPLILKRSIAKRIVLVTFTFIVCYLTAYIIFPNSYWAYYFAMPASGILTDIFVNLGFSIAIIEMSLFIDRVLNEEMSWMLHPFKRLLTQAFFQIVNVLFVVILLVIIYLKFGIPKDSASSQITITHSIYTLLSITLWALIVSALNTGDFLLKNWKTATMQAADFEIKAARNKQLAAEIELQALKLQLDPHFVFNSLSVLSELILKDQQLGYEYTENFAKVYRYLLINSKKKLITVREELKFLDAYLFLISHRMGKGTVFQIDVDESKLDMMIPPVTLQLFIENALKYNRTEEDNPLTIRIYSNDSDELIVSNTLLPLVKKEDSTGIGLKNIMSRYALLEGRTISIEQDSEFFTVKVPLIK